jgi:hypothetical protein
MRAALGLLTIAVACDAGRQATPPPTPTPRVVADAAVVAMPVDAAMPAGPTLLHPVAMAGPFPTIDDACLSATPCGFTVIADQTGRESKPPTEAGCAMGETDPNGVAPRSAGQSIELDHTAPNGIELRIASQSCAVPKGLRGEQDRYYMFVKRADGWWRSDALWEFRYNDKYVSGAMRTRWNDQPNATFVGVAGILDEIACDQQGTSLITDELMVRVEAGSAHPLVWAPLEVGRRYEQTKRSDGDPAIDCPSTKTAHELDETWTSPDELQLIGSAWGPPSMDDGLIQVGFSYDGDQPTTVSYRFVR